MRICFNYCRRKCAVSAAYMLSAAATPKDVVQREVARNVGEVVCRYRTHVFTDTFYWCFVYIFWDCLLHHIRIFLQQQFESAAFRSRQLSVVATF